MTYADNVLDEIISTVRGNRDRLDGIIEKMALADHEVLVSCTEAARLMGVTTTTVSKMIREHRLRKVTLGFSTGIRLSDVRKIMNP